MIAIALLGFLTTAVPANTSAVPPPVFVESTPDPTRLALGRSIAAKLFPQGTFEKLSHQSTTIGLQTVETTIVYAPLEPIIQKTGLSQPQLAALSQGWPGKAMAIIDTHWAERIRLGLPAINKAVVTILSQHEPKIQEGLARGYATVLTADQLKDLNDFLSTPGGEAYATNAMLLQPYSPITSAIHNYAAEISASLPQIRAAFEAATSSLPLTRSLDEVSASELNQIAKIFGINASSLKR
jgi:hypothetical protein